MMSSRAPASGRDQREGPLLQHNQQHSSQQRRQQQAPAPTPAAAPPPSSSSVASAMYRTACQSLKQRRRRNVGGNRGGQQHQRPESPPPRRAPSRRRRRPSFAPPSSPGGGTEATFTSANEAVTRGAHRATNEATATIGPSLPSSPSTAATRATLESARAAADRGADRARYETTTERERKYDEHLRVEQEARTKLERGILELVEKLGDKEMELRQWQGHKAELDRKERLLSGIGGPGGGGGGGGAGADDGGDDDSPPEPDGAAGVGAGGPVSSPAEQSTPSWGDRGWKDEGGTTSPQPQPQPQPQGGTTRTAATVSSSSTNEESSPEFDAETRKRADETSSSLPRRHTSDAGTGDPASELGRKTEEERLEAERSDGAVPTSHPIRSSAARSGPSHADAAPPPPSDREVERTHAIPPPPMRAATGANPVSRGVDRGRSDAAVAAGEEGGMGGTGNNDRATRATRATRTATTTSSSDTFPVSHWTDGNGNPVSVPPPPPPPTRGDPDPSSPPLLPNGGRGRTKGRSRSAAAAGAAAAAGGGRRRRKTISDVLRPISPTRFFNRGPSSPLRRRGNGKSRKHGAALSETTNLLREEATPPNGYDSSFGNSAVVSPGPSGGSYSRSKSLDGRTNVTATAYVSPSPPKAGTGAGAGAGAGTYTGTSNTVSFTDDGPDRGRRGASVKLETDRGPNPSSPTAGGGGARGGGNAGKMPVSPCLKRDVKYPPSPPSSPPTIGRGGVVGADDVVVAGGVVRRGGTGGTAAANAPGVSRDASASSEPDSDEVPIPASLPKQNGTGNDGPIITGRNRETVVGKEEVGNNGNDAKGMVPGSPLSSLTSGDTGDPEPPSLSLRPEREVDPRDGDCTTGGDGGENKPTPTSAAAASTSPSLPRSDSSGGERPSSRGRARRAKSVGTSTNERRRRDAPSDIFRPSSHKTRSASAAVRWRGDDDDAGGAAVAAESGGGGGGGADQQWELDLLSSLVASSASPPEGGSGSGGGKGGNTAVSTYIKRRRAMEAAKKRTQQREQQQQQQQQQQDRPEKDGEQRDGGDDRAASLAQVEATAVAVEVTERDYMSDDTECRPRPWGGGGGGARVTAARRRTGSSHARTMGTDFDERDEERRRLRVEVVALRRSVSLERAARREAERQLGNAKSELEISAKTVKLESMRTYEKAEMKIRQFRQASEDVSRRAENDRTALESSLNNEREAVSLLEEQQRRIDVLKRSVQVLQQRLAGKGSPQSSRKRVDEEPKTVAGRDVSESDAKESKTVILRSELASTNGKDSAPRKAELPRSKNSSEEELVLLTQRWSLEKMDLERQITKLNAQLEVPTPTERSPVVSIEQLEEMRRDAEQKDREHKKVLKEYESNIQTLRDDALKKEDIIRSAEGEVKELRKITQGKELALRQRHEQELERVNKKLEADHVHFTQKALSFEETRKRLVNEVLLEQSLKESAEKESKRLSTLLEEQTSRAQAAIQFLKFCGDGEGGVLLESGKRQEEKEQAP